MDTVAEIRVTGSRLPRWSLSGERIKTKPTMARLSVPLIERSVKLFRFRQQCQPWNRDLRSMAGGGEGITPAEVFLRAVVLPAMPESVNGSLPADGFERVA